MKDHWVVKQTTILLRHGPSTPECLFFKMIGILIDTFPVANIQTALLKEPIIAMSAGGVT